MKKVFCILGMVFSLGMTAFSIVFLFVMDHPYGSYLDSASFGADFYTYIYKGSQSINTSIRGIGSFMYDVMVFFTILFAIMGVISFCFFGVKLAKETKKENLGTTTSLPAPNLGTANTNI
ncbi:MAG: hypothetical protein IKP95_04820 [Ruminococcus sp.]|nr:hypothetical protein [Ruminococcus sp.]